MREIFFSSVGKLKPFEYLKLFEPVYNKLCQSSEPILIYGTGLFTEYIFNRFDINKLNVIGFSDGDALKYGKDFFNKKILPIDDFKEQNISNVLFFSACYQKQIKEKLSTIFDSNVCLIPALNFNYYNTNSFSPLLPSSFSLPTFPLFSKENILFFIDTEYVCNDYLYLIKHLKDLGKKIEIVTTSEYIKNGLDERGFEVVNIELGFKKYQKTFYEKINYLEKEGEIIKQFEQSKILDNLTFPDTKFALSESIFYDRLLLGLNYKIGLKEYISEFFQDKTFDSFVFFSGMSSVFSSSVLLKVIEHNIDVFYDDHLINNNMIFNGIMEVYPNRYIMDFSKGSACVILSDDVKIMDYVKVMDDKIVIVFDEKKRWEIREYLKELFKNEDKKISVILKCKEKYNSFNGYMCEKDFCEKYFKDELENKNFKIVDDE